MDTNKLRSAAHELARYSYFMNESIKLHQVDNYEFWRGRFYAAKDMFCALTALDCTTIGNDNDEVIVMLSDENNCYTFEFRF